MNWKRIGIYTAILFCATALAAFPFGVVVGFVEVNSRPAPQWAYWGEMLAVPAAAVMVFMCLAKVQAVKTWEHAVMVGLLTWLASLPLNVGLLGVSFLAWAMGVVFLALTIGLGVPLGILWRNRDPGPAGDCGPPV